MTFDKILEFLFFVISSMVGSLHCYSVLPPGSFITGNIYPLHVRPHQPHHAAAMLPPSPAALYGNYMNAFNRVQASYNSPMYTYPTAMAGNPSKRHSSTRTIKIHPSVLKAVRMLNNNEKNKRRRPVRVTRVQIPARRKNKRRPTNKPMRKKKTIKINIAVPKTSESKPAIVVVRPPDLELDVDPEVYEYGGNDDSSVTEYVASSSEYDEVKAFPSSRFRPTSYKSAEIAELPISTVTTAQYPLPSTSFTTTYATAADLLDSAASEVSKPRYKTYKISKCLYKLPQDSLSDSIFFD